MHAFENLGLVAHLSSFFESLMGLLLGSSLLYWIGAIASRVFDREALGEGDVKLLGCIGAFCGWKGAVFTIFGGAMVGCIFMIPMLLLSRLGSRKEDLDRGDRKIEWGMEVPFGPFLAIAAILFWVGARFWVEEWFSEKLNPFLEFIGA
jgi:leader peptidase (prepilin peptidase)/N-methyltransferase